MFLSQLTELIRSAAHPLCGADDDYEPLLESIGDARLVLLGEATQGTHEFYRERARITQRLIREKGFQAVAIEADWPDAWRVNRFVQGQSRDPHPHPNLDANLETDLDADLALIGFHRFPAWTWRNNDVLEFVSWLRAHNDTLEPAQRVGFFGLDRYNLHASVEWVLQYLDSVDAAAARRARIRYECYEAFAGDPQTYGYAASLGLHASYGDHAVAQLLESQNEAARYAGMKGMTGMEDLFGGSGRPLHPPSAEEFYRAIFQRADASWKLRDRHMADTLEALLAYLEGRQRSHRRVPEPVLEAGAKTGPQTCARTLLKPGLKTELRDGSRTDSDADATRKPPASAKVVVWAHNAHIGDARATQMGHRSEWNLGQILRERYGRACRSVGFTTYAGTVTAASAWDRPAERLLVRPARGNSYEGLFHAAGLAAFSLSLNQHPDLALRLGGSRLERAIGAVYQPGSELMSHYFLASLPDQFDTVLHFDTTSAVEPLEPGGEGSEFETAERTHSAP